MSWKTTAVPLRGGAREGGATFVIELPVDATPSAIEEVSAAAAAAPIPPKVMLVVDDEPEVAGVVADLLSAYGHSVDTAGNEVIALEKLRMRAYDLVLCDLRMPELDGPALYSQLRQHDPHLCQRFIFLTGDTFRSANHGLLAAKWSTHAEQAVRSG